MKYSFNIIIFLFFILTACVHETDYFDVKTGSELVLNSMINPKDSLMRVHLSRTSPLIQDSNEKSKLTVNNANIKLTNGDTDYLFYFNEKEKSYESPLNTDISGDTWSIEVNKDDTILFAQTTIPEEPTIHPSSSTTTTIDKNDSLLIFDITLSWDNTHQNVLIYSTIYGKVYSLNNPQDYTIPFNIISAHTNTFKLSSFMHTDTSFQYQTKTAHLKTTVDTAVFLYDSIQVSLLVGDNVYKNYYEYSSQVSENFDLREMPMNHPITYTNIENGLGVFGSYNVSTLTSTINDSIVLIK